MFGDIETHQFLFPLQQDVIIDLFSVRVEREFKSVLHLFHVTEEADHATLSGGTFILAVLHGAFNCIKQLVTFAIGQ